MGPADLAEFQARVRSLRYAAFADNVSKFPPEMAERLATSLLSAPFSDSDVMREMNSIAGVLFFVERSIRKNDPGFSLERACDAAGVGLTQLDDLKALYEDVTRISMPPNPQAGGDGASAAADSTPPQTPSP